MNQKLNPNYKNNNCLVSLSSPSGGGKTRLAHGLLNSNEKFVLSTSYTTRNKRPKEIDGKDYFFVKLDEFKQKISNNDFIEFAKVFGNFYGTDKKQVLQNLKQNKIVVFDVDWQGAVELKQYFKDSLISIFIIPPSIKTLEERLRSRRSDSDEIINKRMEQAINEVKHYSCADYVVINDNLATCLADIQYIIFAKLSSQLDMISNSSSKAMASKIAKMFPAIKQAD